MEKIKSIHISEDGAKWITAHGATIPIYTYYLDKLNYKQVLRQMILDIEEYWIAEPYVK